jgi:hypothetical protein
MKQREIGTSNDNQDRMKLLQFLEEPWDVVDGSLVTLWGLQQAV